MTQFYEIWMIGTTYFGNTNFPMDTTSYSVAERFSMFGLLAVDQPIPAVNSGNGPNIIDVGLYVGSIYDSDVRGGEIQWASNNAIHDELSSITGTFGTQRLGIDETFQSVDPQTGAIVMTVDPSISTTTTIDTFIKQSSLLSGPDQIQEGGITLSVTEDGSAVAGNAFLIGNGFIEPGSSAWQAEFAGRPVNSLEDLRISAAPRPVSDVDGDLLDDVVFYSTSTGQIAYIDMGAAAAGPFTTLVDAMPTGWHVRATGDLSGNLRDEAVVQDAGSGSIYAFEAGRGWAEVATDLSADWTLEALGDFTGDQIVDPLIRNGAGQLYLLDIDAGGGSSGYRPVADVGGAWRTIGAGDADRDGSADVVMQNVVDGSTVYANLNGGFLVGWGLVTGALDAGWEARAVADLHGDGAADVIFRNAATGQIWGINMTGAGNAGWFVVHDSPGTAWDIAGALDHDGDGYQDLLVRQADGTTYALDIDAGGFAGWDVITGTMGPDWVLV